MAGAVKKWAIGCGIGCGIPLILVVIIGGFAANIFKDFGGETKERQIVQEELEELYGDSDEFAPNADGSLDPDRLDVFLAIRHEFLEAGAELSGHLTKLDSDVTWLTKASSGVKMVPALVTYGKVRVQTLLEMGMGLGEYQYIYTLAYFNVLAIDPNSGPGFLLDESDFDRDDDGPYIGTSVEVLQFINAAQRDWLSLQLEAHESTLPASTKMQDDEWGAQLLAEKRALVKDRERLMWADGLPDLTAASFAPYRARLQGTHDPMLMLIEIGLSDIN